MWMNKLSQNDYLNKLYFDVFSPDFLLISIYPLLIFKIQSFRNRSRIVFYALGHRNKQIPVYKWKVGRAVDNNCCDKSDCKGLYITGSQVIQGHLLPTQSKGCRTGVYRSRLPESHQLWSVCTHGTTSSL